MVDPTTVNRGYAVPVRGSDVGTWDVPVNSNMGLLDTQLGALTVINVTSGTITLTPSQYANGTIFLSGTLTGPVLIVFPAISGWWSIFNNTINSGSVTAGVFIGTSGGSQLIGMPPGEQIDIQVYGVSVFYRNLGRVGSYLDLAATAIPLWITGSTVKPYLLCDGSTFSSGTYPILANLLGSTTLPDIRGRARFYLNGGTGRITTSLSGIDGNTMFSGGGGQTSAITSASQLPNTTFPHSGLALSIINGNITVPVKSNGVSSGPGAASAQGSVDGGTNQVASNSGTVGIQIDNQGFASSGGSSATIPSMNPAIISGICLIRAS